MKLLLQRRPQLHSLKHSPAGQSQAGFSLIELLVSMALLGIIAGIGVSLFAVINNAYNRADAVSRMQTQGQQMMEQLERSIRSASEVAIVAGTDDLNDDCTANQCLILTIPTASIEYTLNGQCQTTAYSWSDANFTPGLQANGSLKRYTPAGSSGSCTLGTIDMFDTNTRTGISVEPTSGNVFTLSTASSITNVSISFNLTQGVERKPASGADNRAKVPLKTTTSLRNY